MKWIIVFGLLISFVSARELAFDNGKSLELKDMKEKYKTHEIEVWNPYIRKLEKYYAFNMKKILNDVYGD
jgi:mono/diheme cytochrome c family protein